MFKMKIMTWFFVALGGVLLSVGFVNCSPREFDEVAQQSSQSSGGEETGRNPASGGGRSNPSNPSLPVDVCVEPGQRVDDAATNGNKYIYYLKCDGELDQWIDYFEKKCCSGRVKIIDINSHYNSYCPDQKRYGGEAYCL